MTRIADESRLRELITESQDLQADALRDARDSLPELREVGDERRAKQIRPDVDELRAFSLKRRALLRDGSLGLGAYAGRSLVAGGLGTALMSVLARSAAAQEGQQIDVQILNTASSIENLAIATYEAALGLPFIANGNATVIAFAETTRDQHSEHSDAFNAQAEALGGQRQSEQNSALVPVVEEAKAQLQGPLDVIELAAMLETVATQTYLQNMTQLGGADIRLLMASVMGVEAQHLATLRAVGALLEGGREDLVAIPTQPAELPAAAGSVAFPEPFEDTENAREPREGAVQ